MGRPSNLPFHTLAYAQEFIKLHNCRILNDPGLRLKTRFVDAYEVCGSNSTSFYESFFPDWFTQPRSKKPLKVVVNKHGEVKFERRAPVYSGKRLDHVIRYAYYTESDEIVRFRDLDLLHGIARATSRLAFIMPRRKEKQVPSDPLAYMDNLTNGRECGAALCHFNYTATGRTDIIFDHHSPTRATAIYCEDPPTASPTPTPSLLEENDQI
jgi:hypothetical protein